MGFFDVFLPTLDVYGDASLVIPWYYQGHYAYASLMTVPMVLNYLFTTYKWWAMEKASDKKWSWVLVMLQLWPQWNAFKVMRKIYKKDDRAEELKKRIKKELSSIEPFFESVPSILIMTCIWLHAGGLYNVQQYYDPTSYWMHAGALFKITEDTLQDYYNNYFDCSNTTSLYYTQKNFCAVFDGFGGPAWFFTTYAVSILAGTLGICKFLQNGPVAILPTNLMNWPLVRAFFAVLSPLVAKVLFAGILIGMAYTGGSGDLFDKSTQLWLFPLIFITINILPNLILSVIGISLTTGSNKNLIKTLLDYPAFMVLPAFTHFAVGPPQIRCSKSKDITVSGKFTAINTVLTAICFVITICILRNFIGTRGDIGGPQDLSIFFGIIFSPLLIMSCLCIKLFYLFDGIQKCCK